MKRIQSKITLTYILLAIAILVGAGIFSSIGIESYLRDRLIAEFSAQADLVLLALEESPEDSQEQFAGLVRKLAQRGNFRVTLIASDGKVLQDSDVPPNELRRVQNHLQRPEVQEALRRGIGSHTRTSTTVGADFLYVAKRVDSGIKNNNLVNLKFVRLSIHLEDFQKVINEIRFNIFVAGLLVLMLILGVSMVVSRRISKPIVDIAKSVEAIRAGNLAIRIPIASHDEIGQLAQAVNELVEKLQADIVQLRKLEQVRSQFLGNVSHELRTPIFSIQGFLETLLDGAIDDPNVNRAFLEKAHSHALRLNTLLSDLIDISRIESGEMKMSFRYFNLHDFLESVINELQPSAKQRNIYLRLDTTGREDLQVLGDRERLQQVLNNLIENAMKYNKPGGEVLVTYQLDDGHVRIAVTDTGIGIAQEHLSRVFERFYRIDKERSRETGGTGLGLAIVKHIVEAHGSKMKVVSEVGKGSTFSFILKK